jgi:hypothetical protein
MAKQSKTSVAGTTLHYTTPDRMNPQNQSLIVLSCVLLGINGCCNQLRWNLVEAVDVMLRWNRGEKIDDDDACVSSFDPGFDLKTNQK